MALIQNAYQAIIDRLGKDSEIRRYFTQFHKSAVTQVKDHPYLRVGVSNIGFGPITTAGTTAGVTTITNETQFDLSVTIEVQSDDEDLVTKELLRAVEIFANALEGTDITFGQLFQGDLLINFTTFENLFSGESKIFKTDGVITHKIQPYSGGTL